MRTTPSIRDGKLRVAGNVDGAIPVGSARWRTWLGSDPTTFRFVGSGITFTARREYRRSRPYWYAYHRRGNKLEKAYLGRPEELDAASLETVAARFQRSTPSPNSISPISSADQHGRPPHLLATRVPLVGRERDAALVQERILDSQIRLVTLTGTAGIGKTALAIEVAARSADAFEDGLALVDLAALTRPDQVIPAVARSLGLKHVGHRPLREAVYEWLARRRLLLLLDNFEHVLDAAADLSDLLAVCTRVTALVTSREPLRIRSEHVVLVPPLEVPERRSQVQPEQIASAAAITLFVERARARDPAFQLTAANAADVAEACARLDGLPLAIELAAARVPILTPREIVARLEHRLPLLVSGARDVPVRQRTLRDAIDWSHDLLSLEEKILFRRLAVFSGGFDMQAASAVAGASPNAEVQLLEPRQSAGQVLLETLQSLVDKSLLRRDQAGLAPRLRILETVREYALERLEASREAEMLRARHAAYCLALVHHVNSDPVEAARPNQLESDHDNIRAALRWSLEGGDLAMGLRLATALRRFWWRGGYLGEGRRWTSELLHEAGQGPDLRATPEWAAALGLAGYLAWAQADYDTAVTLHRQALERWVGLGNRRGVAAAQGFLGTALCWQGDLSAGASQLDQALAGWRALHHPVGAGNALFQLGLIALFQHRFDDADGSLRAALALHRTSANRLDAAYDLTMIGYVAVHRGRLVEAQDSLGQAADEMSRTDDRWGVLFLLESAAALAVAAGEPLRGLELIGTASALRERTGAALPPPFRERLARWIARARASLSEAEAETALAAGRARAPGQAIDADELQALVGCTTVQDPSPRSPPRLTPREKQIVVLLARGGTNQQIAGELVLSPRTVESHVSHILGKLDFTTRAQIAAWASRQSLVGMPSSR